MEIEEGALQVRPSIRMVPDESDYRRERIGQIRRDIADIDRQLGSPSVPAAASRYKQSKQPKPNLEVSRVRGVALALEGHVWTDKPHNPNNSQPGILIDISNVPGTHASTVACTDYVRACVELEAAQEPRMLCPLPWLYHETNALVIAPAERQTVVLAIGPLIGIPDNRPWAILMNRKSDATPSYGAREQAVFVDHHDVPRSDFSFWLLVLEVESGQIIGRWRFKWIASSTPRVERMHD